MKKSFTRIFLFFLFLASSLTASAQQTDTLYAIDDAYTITMGGGQGKSSFIKFDISSIPANSVVGNVMLHVNVTEVGINWDGDMIFYNVNSQTWMETDSMQKLYGYSRTDSTLQLGNFGTTTGWASSINLSQIFLKDYNLANNFCTVMLKDSNDVTFAPNNIPSIDSNDSLMSGNIFGDYIIYDPHEQSDSIPMMIVTYTIAPTVVVQPPNISVCDNISAATFSITATGDAPLSYQWQKNGVDIAGATSDIYTINPAMLSDAGNYRCYVTNAVGSDTSAVGMLFVSANPAVNLGSDSVTCAASVLLDAGNAGANFLWSTAATTQTVTASSSGNYFVEVTDANGCKGSDTIMVTFNAAPIVNLGADTAWCGSGMLDAGNAGSSYLWNTGATTQTIAVSVTDTFYVDVTNFCGTVSDTVIITVNAAPVISAGSNITVCSGGIDTLCVSGGINYSWSTGASGSCILVSPSATTSYNVIGADANGCTNTDTVTVTVGGGPAVSTTSTPASCLVNDGTATANSSGGTPPYFYSWTGGQTTQTATGLSSGTYTVNITDAQGCSAAATATVGATNTILPTVFSGGNGQDGNMFDVTAINSVIIESFDGNLDDAAGGGAGGNMEIYYKVGTHVGFETNAGAWTLIGTAFVDPTGVGIPTAIPVNINLTIPAGQTYAFYITGNNTGNDVDYTDGTAFGTPSAADANLQIREGVGKAYPFGATYPAAGPPGSRIWNGQIHYCIGPVGVENILSSEMNVYPNPSNGTFTISGLPVSATIQVMNIFGAVVFEKTASATSETINLDEASGIYFYRLTDANGTTGTGKIVIE